MSAVAVAAMPGLAQVEPFAAAKNVAGRLGAPASKPRKHGRGASPRRETADSARECAGEIDERFRAVASELRPRTVLSTYFTRRIAVNMVRTEKCERHEAAMLAFRQRHAGEAFDRAREEVAQALLRRFDGDDPRAARAAWRELLMVPEGVDLLTERLVILRSFVAREEPSWSLDNQESLRLTCGWLDEEVTPARGWTLARAVLRDTRLLGTEDRAAALVASNLTAWAGRELAGEIDREIDRLEQHRLTLDHETIEQDRLEAAERTTFDPSPAAGRARA